MKKFTQFFTSIADTFSALGFTTRIITSFIGVILTLLLSTFAAPGNFWTLLFALFVCFPYLLWIVKGRDLK